jgi:hypothetical protein
VILPHETLSEQLSVIVCPELYEPAEGEALTVAGVVSAPTTAVQVLLLIPPLRPEHVHVQGPEPLTDDGVPILHNLSVGWDE